MFLGYSGASHAYEQVLHRAPSQCFCRRGRTARDSKRRIHKFQCCLPCKDCCTSRLPTKSFSYRIRREEWEGRKKKRTKTSNQKSRLEKYKKKEKKRRSKSNSTARAYSTAIDKTRFEMLTKQLRVLRADVCAYDEPLATRPPIRH